MAESMPEPKPEAAELPGKPVLNGAPSAANLIEGSDPDPDQYGWGV
jgi:hypothetical protein